MNFQSTELEKEIRKALKSNLKGYWKQSLAMKFYNRFKWNTLTEIWEAINFYIQDFFFCNELKKIEIERPEAYERLNQSLASDLATIKII